MDKETREITQVDSDIDPQWQHNYLHRSGQPFIVEEEPTPDEPTLEIVEDQEMPQDVGGMTLEEAQVKYVDVTGKELPARYKNDLTWLLSKINS